MKPMPTCCPFRLISIVAVAVVLLPMVMSCNRAQAPADVDKTKSDKPVADDPNAIRLDKTIADYTEAIRVNPNATDSRGVLLCVKRGGAYADKGENDKAIADFTEAIRIYPTINAPFLSVRMMEVCDARSTAYMKKGEYDKAIADCTEVIQLGGKSHSDLGEALAYAGFVSGSYFNRGVCYDEKDEHEKALADYKEAVRIEPGLANNQDFKKRMSK